MQPDLVDYIDAQKARDRAIAKHSKRQAGRQFLSKARAIAQLICREKGSCTVNDIRERVGNPPEECSPTIMGAIFRDPAFEFVRYEANPRKVCHARPVARFKLAGAV